MFLIGHYRIGWLKKLNIQLLLKLKVLTEVIAWLKVKYKSVAEAKKRSWSWKLLLKLKVITIELVGLKGWWHKLLAGLKWNIKVLMKRFDDPYKYMMRLQGNEVIWWLWWLRYQGNYVTWWLLHGAIWWDCKRMKLDDSYWFYD